MLLAKFWSQPHAQTIKKKQKQQQRQNSANEEALPQGYLTVTE